MKLSDLESKIAVRADASVQAKIKVFKAEIDAALNKLFGNAGSGIDRFGMYEYVETSTTKPPIVKRKLAALKLAIRDHVKNSDGTRTETPWPKQLWESEREDIRNDLLSKMDLMQKLLNSPVRSTADDVPAEEGANVV
jgi:hypothetical protein